MTHDLIFRCLVVGWKPRRILKSLLEQWVKRANLPHLWHLQARQRCDFAPYLRFNLLIIILVIDVIWFRISRKQQLLLELGTHIGFEIILRFKQWKSGYNAWSLLVTHDPWVSIMGHLFALWMKIALLRSFGINCADSCKAILVAVRAVTTLTSFLVRWIGWLDGAAGNRWILLE